MLLLLPSRQLARWQRRTRDFLAFTVLTRAPVTSLASVLAPARLPAE